MIHLPALLDAIFTALHHLGAHHFLWSTVGKHLSEIWTRHWLIIIKWRG